MKQPTAIMLGTPAMTAFFLLGVVTFAVLRKFADCRTPWHVLASTWLAWFLSFSMVVLIPLDIAVALQAGPANSVAAAGVRPPEADIDAAGLGLAWGLVYWGSFLMMTLVLPTHSSYCDSGAFTATGRLRDALRIKLVCNGHSLWALLWTFSRSFSS